MFSLWRTPKLEASPNKVMAGQGNNSKETPPSSFLNSKQRWKRAATFTVWMVLAIFVGGDGSSTSLQNDPSVHPRFWPKLKKCSCCSDILVLRMRAWFLMITVTSGSPRPWTLFCCSMKNTPSPPPSAPSAPSSALLFSKKAFRFWKVANLQTQNAPKFHGLFLWRWFTSLPV